MDPFTVLLHGDKKQHLWCGPGETISFTLLSALVSLASKSAECVELEDLMSEQLSCCLNCVRVFHLTLSYSDADSLGLDEQDFALLRDYLEGLALNRVSKTLASGLGSDKRWTPALSNAFLEVLNYTSLLRNSSLFGVVEDFVVSLLDANVSIPKKSKCAGVFVLCASSVDRVHRWAEQYVGNCEAQGTIVSVDEVEDVLDRALDVLLDAAQGQRVIEGQNSVLGSSQGGLVVFEGERFYSSLWFLLERVTSDMKKHYFNNWTVRFSLLLRTVFTRVDAKLVGGDQPVRVLCSLIKACAMTGAAGEVSTSPEVLWGDPEVLSFADSLDMLMERACSSYEALPAMSMKALIQCFLWMCLCAPAKVRLDAQDRVIQFLLVGEMAGLADGAYIMDAQEQVLYIVAQGAKEGYPPLKTEKLWAHPLVSMAAAKNASRNAISIVSGLIKRLQPKESPDKVPVFMQLWSTCLSTKSELPAALHEALWHSHSKMTIRGSYMVDLIRGVFAQYLERLMSELKPPVWLGNVMKDLFSMMTCFHKDLPNSAVKFFRFFASKNVDFLRNVIAGVLDWFQNQEPETSNAGLWVFAVSMVMQAAKNTPLDLKDFADGVVEMLLALPDDIEPTKEMMHGICSLMEPVRRWCSNPNVPRLRTVLDWIVTLPEVSADDMKLARLAFPEKAAVAPPPAGPVASGGHSSFDLNAARRANVALTKALLAKAPPAKRAAPVRRPAPPKPSDPVAVAAESMLMSQMRRTQKLSEQEIKAREPARPPLAPLAPLGSLGIKKKPRVKVQPATGEYKALVPGAPMVNEADIIKRRLMPSVEDMFRRVVSWSLADIENEKPDPKLVVLPVPKLFSSADEYQRVFEPLLLLEIRAAMGSALTEQRSDEKPFKMESSNLMRVDQCWTMNLCLTEDPTGPGKDRVLRNAWHEFDVLELGCASWPESVIAVVRKIEFLENLRRELVTVMLQPPPGLQFTDKKWTCSSFFSLVTGSREYRALASLQYLPKWRDFILRGDTKLVAAVGTTAIPPNMIPKSELLERQFNQSQSSAILQCFRDPTGFVLIQGPPGTGKTKTILGIMGAVVASSTDRRKRLLVCAASNRAVDEVAMRMKDGLWDPVRNRTDKVSIVRIGRDAVVNADLLPYTLEVLAKERCAARVSRAEGTISKSDKNITLYKAQLDDLEGKLKEAMELASAFNLARAEKETEKNVKMCEELQEKIKLMLHSKREVRQKLKQSYDGRSLAISNKNHDIAASKDEVIRDADIVFCTLSGAGHESLVKLNLEFDAVIVDEATQATELQTLIPLKYKSKLCVLVGDPKQLPATVISKVAQKSRYDQSLFQRMVTLGVPMQMLNVQYRMHPKICAFPNAMFYDNQLQNGSTVLADKYTKKFHSDLPFSPFLFCNCTSAEEVDKRTFSTMNRGEANLAADVVLEFFRRFGVDAVPGGIAVITPYKRQMEFLRGLLRTRLSPEESKLVDINTIDGFQGCEKDVVIFSCVRSHSGSQIGFLNDVRRLNVALTRARFSTVVLGNEKLLGQNEVFGELIKHAKIRNVFVEEAKLRLELAKGKSGAATGEGVRVKRAAAISVPVAPPLPRANAPTGDAEKPALYILPKGDPINQELMNFNRKRDREDETAVRRSTKPLVDHGAKQASQGKRPSEEGKQRASSEKERPSVRPAVEKRPGEDRERPSVRVTAEKRPADEKNVLPDSVEKRLTNEKDGRSAVRPRPEQKRANVSSEQPRSSVKPMVEPGKPRPATKPLPDEKQSGKRPAVKTVPVDTAAPAPFARPTVLVKSSSEVSDPRLKRRKPDPEPNLHPGSGVVADPTAPPRPVVADRPGLLPDPVPLPPVSSAAPAPSAVIGPPLVRPPPPPPPQPPGPPSKHVQLPPPPPPPPPPSRVPAAAAVEETKKRGRDAEEQSKDVGAKYVYCEDDPAAATGAGRPVDPRGGRSNLRSSAVFLQPVKFDQE